METKDLFNLSADAMAQLVNKAAEIEKSTKEGVTTASYNCICCGSGICAVGIADD